MPDDLLYDVKVSALTPLHIGNGVRLLHEYDYAIRGGRTWRLNEARVLEHQLPADGALDPALADQLAKTPPARLLQPGDFRPDHEVFRYVIQGTPRSAAEGAQVQEALKDTFDRPFLPGGSLKGALGTALAWVGWERQGLKPELSKLGRRREWAGQRYEQEIFGRDSNHDVLRALQVSDSQPVSPERLMILNVRALNRSGKLAAPIELEAIRPDTVFEMTLKIDRALYSEWAKRDGQAVLQGGERLEQLEQTARAHARQRIQEESAYYRGVADAKRLLGYYQQLDKLQSQLGKGQFFLQVGWGTGWDDKTFGSRLKKDAAFFVRMVNDYRLSKGEYVSGPFPASRRVAVTMTKAPDGQVVETPAYPLGWVLVEMEEKRLNV